MNQSLHQEIATLRARNKFLEEEIKQLRPPTPEMKEVLGLRYLQSKFNLTNTEVAILYGLSGGLLLSCEVIEKRFSRCGFVSPNYAKVLVCKIRQKITPLTITTVKQKGYMLEGENLEAVRAVIGGGV